MSSWYPTRLDPFSGNFVERFAQLLSGEYQVSVIHTRGDDTCSHIEEVIEDSEGVRTVRIYHPVRSNRLWHWFTQRKALNRALDLVEDVDLVFAHVILPRGLQFIKAKNYYHCPLIVMEHASYYREAVLKQMSRLHQTILKRTSFHINELLACSEFLKADMKAVFPTTKTTVLPNFVDTQLFSVAENRVATGNQFIHVSTLDESVKDPHLLFEAVEICVKNGYTQVQMTIISDQPTKKWQRLAERMEISQYFRFEGPSSWETISEEMREHDAFVLCSSYETFSIVLVEAWLSGVPTITTPVGIGKDLDPALGIQVPVKDADAIARAMQQIMDKAVTFDPQALRRAGMQFSEDNVTAQLSGLFHQYDHYND